jgi:biopolymer transport protein ExbD
MVTVARIFVVFIGATTASCSTDERNCRTPSAAWIEHPNDMGFHPPAISTVRLDHRGLPLFNAKQVDWQELSQFLQRVAVMTPQPVILFRPSADAPCEAVAKVRSAMQRELRCTEYAACGEGPEWSDIPDQRDITM